MPRKPRFTQGPATKYEATNEIIREFAVGTAGTGGLLSLRHMDDGSLIIDLYQMSGPVRINVPKTCPWETEIGTVNGVQLCRLVLEGEDPYCTTHMADLRENYPDTAEATIERMKEKR